MRREARLWLLSALEDLEDAEDMLKRDKCFRAASFAQQATEKALEALYFVVLRREPPKTHIVTELYRRLKEGSFSLPKDVEKKIYVLNKYYTVTRYPDAANGLPSESVDCFEAERALSIAMEVVDFAKRRLEEEGA
ncbi:MAG: HEPN domain-containing protein [Crenarchaeota archaeon]|nr:HEPN domain-containing protein [Thermoproteota archaeon]